MKSIKEFRKRKVVFEEGKLPLRIMVVIFIVVMSEQITSEVTFPFVPFMIQGFNICPPEQIGYYAGAIASAFGLAQILSSLVYGKLSDRIGRKWLLIVGAIGNTITMPVFGLSRNLWEALAFRSIVGIVNGNSALIRAVIGDITDETTAAKAWSYWGLAFALGRMIAMGIGGVLANPAATFPHLIPKDAFLDVFPYFLPPLMSGIFSFFSIFAIYFVLPETRGIRNSKKELEVTEPLLLDPTQSVPKPKSTWKILFTKDVIFVVLCNMFLWIDFMAHDEVFALWAKNPPSEGGVGFDAIQIGIFWIVSGVHVLIVQLIVYPFLAKNLTHLKLERVGNWFCILTIAATPFYSLATPVGAPLVWFVLILGLFLLVIGGQTTLNSIGVLGNNAVTKSEMGVFNGFMQAGVSVGRVLGPVGASSLLAYSLTEGKGRFPLDFHLVYFVLAAIQLIVFLLTFFLSPKLNKPKELL